MGPCSTLDLLSSLISQPLKGYHSLQCRPYPCFYGNSEQRGFLSSLRGRVEPISFLHVGGELKNVAHGSFQLMCPTTEGIPSLWGAPPPGDKDALLTPPPVFKLSDQPFAFCASSPRSVREHVRALNRVLLAFKNRLPASYPLKKKGSVLAALGGARACI